MHHTHTTTRSLLAVLALLVAAPFPIAAQTSSNVEECFELEEGIRTQQAIVNQAYDRLDFVDFYADGGQREKAAALIVAARRETQKLEALLFEYGNRCGDLVANLTDTEISKRSCVELRFDLEHLTYALDLNNYARNRLQEFKLQEDVKKITAELDKRCKKEDQQTLEDVADSTEASPAAEKAEAPDQQKELELPVDSDFNRIEGTQGRQQDDSFEKLVDEEEAEQKREPGFFARFAASIASFFSSFGSDDTDASVDTASVSEQAEQRVATNCSIPETDLHQLYPLDVYTYSDQTDSGFTVTRQSCRSKSADEWQLEAEGYSLSIMQESCPSAVVTDVNYAGTNVPCSVSFGW